MISEGLLLFSATSLKRRHLPIYPGAAYESLKKGFEQVFFGDDES